MNALTPQAEFLLLSRGKWDTDSPKEEIEAAIARFYDWYEGNLASGRFKPGWRLTTEGATVSKSGIALDGPFGETKEVIGGYWIIVAGSLREAAEIASQSPCARHGLRYEIRPLEAARGSVYRNTNETPDT